MIIVLDSGVVGLIIYPKGTDESTACSEWLESVIEQGHTVALPSIVDYEVRRELIRIGSLQSLQRLDRLVESLECLEVTPSVLREAAKLWADARNSGQKTADDKAIDCDMLIVAAAFDIGTRTGEDVVVATTNVRHLARFIDARPWREIR